jgi:hypothetical protein
MRAPLRPQLSSLMQVHTIWIEFSPTYPLPRERVQYIINVRSVCIDLDFVQV